MTSKELYVELKKAQYDSRPYHRITMMGNKMEIVEQVIDGYWRERFLLNDSDKTAYELMDNAFILKSLSEKILTVRALELSKTIETPILSRRITSVSRSRNSKKVLLL